MRLQTGIRRLIAATLACAAIGGASAQAANGPVKIISIDVEGGAATLYVTPEGHSLLIDSGWPAGRGGPRVEPGAPPPPPTPSSAQRIAAAVKAAGLSKIDYFVLSHYHVDHIGGAVELIGLVPIGTFINHGPNREAAPPNATPAQLTFAPAALYPAYEAAIAGKPQRVMQAGDTLKIDDVTFTAIDSDGQPIAKPVSGAGKPGVGCAAATTNAQTGGEENPRSLGLLMTYGKARVISLGDTTWDVENALACPTDRIGKVDLMFADNHGTGNANSPPLIQTVAPTVFVLGNGMTKGADTSTYDTITAVSGADAVWQLHTATRTPDKNAAPDHIANLDGPDALYPLQIAVEKSGLVTVTNPRTGKSQAYPKR